MNSDTLVLSTGEGQMDILNPTPEQVNTTDMLRNLSRMYRFCGASPMSVLQHSLYVGLHAGLHGYMHDLHEYVTGDIPAPLLVGLFAESKSGRWSSLRGAQDRIQRVIESRLGKAGPSPESLHCVVFFDAESRKIERALMADTTGEYQASQPNEVKAILDLTPEQAIEMFRAKMAEYGVVV